MLPNVHFEKAFRKTFFFFKSSYKIFMMRWGSLRQSYVDFV